MNDQKKDHIDQKDLRKGLPQTITDHNLPTDDVENINSTKKGRGLLLT